MLIFWFDGFCEKYELIIWLICKKFRGIGILLGWVFFFILIRCVKLVWIIYVWGYLK